MTSSIALPGRRVLTDRRVLADVIPGSLARDAVLVGAAAALTGAAAQVVVPLEPFSPVPLTGQTFTVLLFGAALGPVRAFASMALYLLVGAMGVPWFAGGVHGVGHVSFGYVIGFMAEGTVVGALARRGGDRTPLRTVGTMAVGELTLYAVGVTYLAVAAHLPLGTALAKGVLPFLPGDAIKVALAAGILPATWALVRRFER